MRLLSTSAAAPSRSNAKWTIWTKWTKWTPLAFSLLTATACNRSDPPPANDAAPQASAATYASFTGAGRDRLCLGGSNADAAVVSYGEGNNNCLVRGRIADGALIPNGDDSCRIPLSQQGGRVTIGKLPPACAYYCGPGATLEGKTFTRMENPQVVTDIAGDPLC